MPLLAIFNIYDIISGRVYNILNFDHVTVYIHSCGLLEHLKSDNLVHPAKQVEPVNHVVCCICTVVQYS